MTSYKDSRCKYSSIYKVFQLSSTQATSECLFHPYRSTSTFYCTVCSSTKKNHKLDGVSGALKDPQSSLLEYFRTSRIQFLKDEYRSERRLTKCVMLWTKVTYDHTMNYLESDIFIGIISLVTSWFTAPNGHKMK